MDPRVMDPLTAMKAPQAPHERTTKTRLGERPRGASALAGAGPAGHRNDLRNGEAWTLRQRVKNDVLWVLANLALGAARYMPFAALRAMGRALGAGAHWVAPAARNTALFNVARAMPEVGEEERRALVRRCFETLGELLAETVAVMQGRGGPPLALAGGARQTLEQAQAEGRGVLFASAHLGPWEEVAAALVAAGVPLITLARESYDRRFSRLYDRLRTRTGVAVVWRGSPYSALGILRTLRRGHVLGVPMDLRSRVPSIDVPFLGHPAPTAIGPARIALRTRAAVVVGTAAPRDAGPSPDTHEGPLVVTATRIMTSDLEADEAGAFELTARINAELSQRILALPHAWVWMHPRWAHTTQSEGGATACARLAR